jgi:succinyl-CoA synthetase alpha subunit
MSQHYLHPLFNARSVAVFGASEREDSVAGILFRNLRNAGYKGEVYPVNPKHETIFGERCYASAGDLPAIPELALIATPAPTVAPIMEACGQRGIRHAIVLSAGFREVGEQGAALEAGVKAVAKKHGIRFIGPNCLGVQRPSIGLNATFSQGATLSGDLALVSQSGAICTAMLDWAETNGIGFSSVISTGASADLDFGEILDYLAFDNQTKGILLYIEGIRDARRFMSALRATSRFKPIVMVKVGVTRRAPRRCSRTPARWSGRTRCSTRWCAAPVWCASTPFCSCSPRHARCPPTSSPPATVSPSSPTAAVLASWPPTSRQTWGCAWPSCRRRRSRRSTVHYRPTGRRPIRSISSATPQPIGIAPRWLPVSPTTTSTVCWRC